MRTLALPLLLLSALPPLATATSAQGAAPFAPGYVVSAEGDTLRGEVQASIDLTAAREVVFRPGPDVDPQTFTPETALGYGDGDGRRYVARTVAPEFEGEEAGYFLQVLVDGRLDLFRLAVGPDDDRYFVQGEGAEPVGLYVTRDLVYSTQGRGAGRRGTYEAVQRPYRTSLARAFYGCPEAQAETVDLDLRQRDLVRAVVAFNECVGAPATVATAQATRERDELAWSVTPRLGAGAVYVSDDGPNGWRATPQSAPYVGALVEATLLDLPGRTSISIEGSLQQKGRTPEGFVFPNAPRVLPEDVLGTTYATVAYGFRYAHTPWPVAPYVGLGFLNGFILDAPEPSGNVFFRVEPPTTEAGVWAEVGAEVPLAGGPLTLGLRAERTALASASPLAAFTGGPQTVISNAGTAYNTTLTVTVGKRFGR
jgi:hypothetical protein